MIPTTTGAAKSVGLVIPELDGKLDGQAIRVPVPNVSLLDISVELQKDTDIESLHDVFIKEGKSKMKGIVDVSCEPLVSVDYVGNTYSAVIDCLSTNVLNKRFVKILAWYDNEHGYCCRVLDLLDYLSKKKIASKPQ